jgi:hypothetical protein
LNEDQFNEIWKNLKGMVGLMKTEYAEDDLSYEELTVNRQVSLESSY